MGGQTQIRKGLHTVISDLLETGENDELFLLTGITDVLQLSESDGLRKSERKKRRRPAAGDAGARCGLRLWKQRKCRMYGRTAGLQLPAADVAAGRHAALRPGAEGVRSL